jgi:hypothetical protein
VELSKCECHVCQRSLILRELASYAPPEREAWVKETIDMFESDWHIAEEEAEYLTAVIKKSWPSHIGVMACYGWKPKEVL